MLQKYVHSGVECTESSENQLSHSKGCVSISSADSYLKKYFVSCLHEIPVKEQIVTNPDEKLKDFPENICNYNMKSMVKKSKYIDDSGGNNVYSQFSRGPHTASCEGVFEMDSEMTEIAQSEIGSVSSKLSSSTNSYTNLSCSVSPTLTVAASFTDKNSVSRGFVIPQENSDP